MLSFCQQTEVRSSTPLTTAMSITSTTRLQEEEGEEGGRSEATDYAGSNEVLEDLGKEDCNYKSYLLKFFLYSNAFIQATFDKKVPSEVVTD